MLMKIRVLLFSGLFRAQSNIYDEDFFAEIVERFSAVRSSRSEVFCKKSVLKNLAKFTGKHLCQCLYLSLQLYSKETLAQVFSCEFY